MKSTLYRTRAIACFERACKSTCAQWWLDTGNKWLHMAQVQEKLDAVKITS